MFGSKVLGLGVCLVLVLYASGTAAQAPNAANRTTTDTTPNPRPAAAAPDSAATTTNRTTPAAANNTEVPGAASTLTPNITTPSNNTQGTNGANTTGEVTPRGPQEPLLPGPNENTVTSNGTGEGNTSTPAEGTGGATTPPAPTPGANTTAPTPTSAAGGGVVNLLALVVSAFVAAAVAGQV